MLQMHHEANLPAILTVPSPLVRTVDALRRPAARIASVGLPALLAWSCNAEIGALHAGFVAFLVGATCVLSAGETVRRSVKAARFEFRTGNSLLNRHIGILSGRGSVAAAAARMLRAEWNHSKITTDKIGAHGKSSDMNVGTEKRLTSVELPNGASVAFMHQRKGRTLVVLNSTSRGPRDFDAKASLGPIDVSVIMGAVERIQLDRLCVLLGVSVGQSALTMSRMLAEALPCRSDDMDVTETGTNPITINDWHVHRTVETRKIGGAEIVVTSIRGKNDGVHSTLLVEAPGMGLLALPTEPFSDVMRRRRSSELRHAFGVGAPEIVTLPVFLGNARASRIADLARQVLMEDPELKAASGSPLRSLIEEHMPRLLATHRDNTRTARTADISEIDAALDRGLDVVARALGEAIDGLADRKLDALRTEVRFLESRHPDAGGDIAPMPVARTTAPEPRRYERHACLRD